MNTGTEVLPRLVFAQQSPLYASPPFPATYEWHDTVRQLDSVMSW